MSGFRPIDELIAELAAGQEGCVEYRQMLEAGVSRGAIEHRIATGRLRRRFKGVYVFAHDAPIRFQSERAAMKATGDGALLVRRSCAYVWGALEHPPRLVEVSVIGARRPGAVGLRFFSGLTLDPRDVTEYRGFRLCTIPKLLLDLSAEGETAFVSRLLNTARVKRLLRPGELDAFIDRSRGRRGFPALEAVVNGPEAAGMSRSRAERLMRALLRRAGLPQPLMNHMVLGEERDFIWIEETFVVETDGWAGHGTRASFENDRRRDAELMAAGWVVLRITWRKLTDEPEWVVAKVAAALAIRARTERDRAA